MWSVTPRSEDQGNLLKNWEENESIDFWEQISRKGKSSRIMVAPDTQTQFEHFLNENNIDHELIIENVERFFESIIVYSWSNVNLCILLDRVFERERQEKVENEIRLKNLESRGQSRLADFSHFWSYTEINRYLTFLTLHYGDVCHTETLGFSREGRAMRALKIGSFDGKWGQGFLPRLLVSCFMIDNKWFQLGFKHKFEIIT